MSELYSLSSEKGYVDNVYKEWNLRVQIWLNHEFLSLTTSVKTPKFGSFKKRGVSHHWWKENKEGQTGFEKKEYVLVSKEIVSGVWFWRVNQRSRTEKEE
jgi:hypothetical protein